MLINLRFRLPEVFFGALLAIAIFAMGMLYETSRRPSSQQLTPGSITNQSQPQHTGGSDRHWLTRLMDWLTHDATGVFTLFLVAVGAIQIGVFLRQLRFIRESVDDAKMAATAARAAANAAQQSADHLHSAERAHINGGMGRWIIDVNSVDGPYMSTNLNNHGKTPGSVTRIAVAIRAVEDLPRQPEYPEGIRPGFMLGPGEKDFPASAANAWAGGSGRRVFYGRICYNDVFEPPTEHYSSFILDLDTGYGILDRPEYWEST
jgi:hypothetical protein